MIYRPYHYQQLATQHILDNPAAGLFLEMGLGKTVSTLTAIDKLLNELFEVSKVLVIAPKRVAEHTWPTEVSTWDHLQHLRVSRVLGTEKQRKEALKAKADIYVINRENVPWLVAQYSTAWPFDMVVIDESSSFKSPKASRFKALKSVRPLIKRVVALTGTPRPNGLLDLWPQLYLLDQGTRLGKTITGFRDRYFKPGKRNGHVVYSYDLNGQKDDGLLGAGIYEKEIYEKIGDICISMKTREYLQLPERIDRIVPAKLSADVMRQYLAFEREQILSLPDVGDISPINAAALTNKLWQFANGAVYDDDKTYHVVHDEMLDVLEEQVEAANGNPLLVFYWFKHDLDRMRRRLKAYNPVELKTSGDIQDWNAGKIPLTLLHPASAGHGLNLQYGGHLMAWFGPVWSSELYLQAVARLDRQGQTQSVYNGRIIVPGTIHDDMVETTDNKVRGQDAMMKAIKARIDKYLKNVSYGKTDNYRATG